MANAAYFLMIALRLF